MTARKINLGASGFSELRESGSLYVDKTPVIRDLIRHPAKVIQIIRPRGFGKTLNLSALHCFLAGGTGSGAATPAGAGEAGSPGFPGASLFAGLEITRDAGFCAEHMGRHPVIHFSLSHASFNRFELTHSIICSIVAGLAKSFRLLGDSPRLDPGEKRLLAQLGDYYHLMNSFGDLCMSLFSLTRMLHAHWGRRAYVLIDSFDEPFAASAKYGYWKEMEDLADHLFGALFSGNPHLEKAVVNTLMPLECCQRTGAWISTLEDPGPGLSQAFGLTEQEAVNMAADSGIITTAGFLRENYGGYVSAGTSLLCPRSVAEFCADNSGSEDVGMICPHSYWRDLDRYFTVQDYLAHMRTEDADMLGSMLEGKEAAIRLPAGASYQGLTVSGSPDFPGFLRNTGFFTGKPPAAEGDDLWHLRIPNHEVAECLREQILSFFSPRSSCFARSARLILNALLEGDPDDLGAALNWGLRTYVTAPSRKGLDFHLCFLADHLKCFSQSDLPGLRILTREPGSGADPAGGSTSGSQREDQAPDAEICLLHDDGECGSPLTGLVLLVSVCPDPGLLADTASRILQRTPPAALFARDLFTGRKLSRQLIYSIAFSGRSCVCLGGVTDSRAE